MNASSTRNFANRTAAPNDGLRHIAGAEETAPPPPGIAAIRPLREVEREAIESAIACCGGSIPRAAALLQVAPSTIYRKQNLWTRASGA